MQRSNFVALLLDSSAIQFNSAAPVRIGSGVHAARVWRAESTSGFCPSASVKIKKCRTTEWQACAWVAQILRVDKMPHDGRPQISLSG